MKLFRFTFENEGIYNAYKQRISFEQWRTFKQSKACEWLPNPGNYSGKAWFTEKGFEMFCKETLPVISKILGRIHIESIEMPDNVNYVYHDNYQVIIPCKES